VKFGVPRAPCGYRNGLLCLRCTAWSGHAGPHYDGREGLHFNNGRDAWRDIPRPALFAIANLSFAEDEP